MYTFFLLQRNKVIKKNTSKQKIYHIKIKFYEKSGMEK